MELCVAGRLHSAAAWDNLWAIAVDQPIDISVLHAMIVWRFPLRSCRPTIEIFVFNYLGLWLFNYLSVAYHNHFLIMSCLVAVVRLLLCRLGLESHSVHLRNLVDIRDLNNRVTLLDICWYQLVHLRFNCVGNCNEIAVKYQQHQ